jgi:hypothetical protein
MPITVVDVSGVHTIAFAYCYCPGRLEPLQQLLALRLWPATVKQPATVFTFAMLDDYHHHSLASRKSAQDYWEVLRRKTNNDFPEEVPVCHPFLIFLFPFNFILGPIYLSFENLTVLQVHSLPRTQWPALQYQTFPQD